MSDVVNRSSSSRWRSGRGWVWRALVVCGVLAGGGLLLAAPGGDNGASIPIVSQPPERHVSVRLTEIRHGPLIQWLFAEGVVQAVRKDFLQFESAGRIELIATDANGDLLREGSRVRGPAPGDRFGQLIARLDDRDSAARVARTDAQVAAARRRVEAVRAALDQTRQAFDRTSGLANHGLTPRAEHERTKAAFLEAQAELRAAEAEARALAAQADEARIGRDRAAIFAPYDGVIAMMNIDVGDYATGIASATRDPVQEANAAVVVIEDSRLEVTLHLPPHEAALVREGQTAYVGADGDAIARAVRGAEDTGALRGRVWSVSPSISLQRRAVMVKVRLDEGTEDRLRDGAFVSVWIAAAEIPQAVLAPYPALIQRATQTTVFIHDPETDQVRRRVVRLGMMGLDHAQVLAGLSPGEQVVAEGHHRLTDGARVRPIETGAADPRRALDVTLPTDDDKQ